MAKTPSKTSWTAGKSGNPRGRPPGTGTVAKLRASIEASVPEISEQLRLAALGGDVAAARLLIERVVPPLKAIEQAAPIALPTGDTLTSQGRAVLAAVASGALAPTQGATVLSALANLARLHEATELEQRIERLEAAADGRNLP